MNPDYWMAELGNYDREARLAVQIVVDGKAHRQAANVLRGYKDTPEAMALAMEDLAAWVRSKLPRRKINRKVLLT